MNSKRSRRKDVLVPSTERRLEELIFRCFPVRQLPRIRDKPRKPTPCRVLVRMQPKAALRPPELILLQDGTASIPPAFCTPPPPRRGMSPPLGRSPGGPHPAEAEMRQAILITASWRRTGQTTFPRIPPFLLLRMRGNTAVEDDYGRCKAWNQEVYAVVC